MREPLTFVVERSITVEVPRERLFDVLNDDSRFLDLRPGAVAHRDVEPLENGGHACTQEFEIEDGRRITQRCRALRFDRPSCMIDDVVGSDFQATVTSTLEDLGAESLLRIRQEVALTRQVNTLRRRAIRRDAERRLDASLRRIKAVAEAT